MTKKEIYLSIFAVVFAFVLVGGGYFVYDHYYLKNDNINSEFTINQTGSSSISIGPKNEAETQQKVVENSQAKQTIRLLAAGDFLTHDTVIESAKTSDGYNFFSMMSGVKTYFEKSDIAFCVDAVSAGGDEGGISGYPDFNAPTQLVKGMADLGCNVVSMSSANMFDKGQPAVNKTLDLWDKQKSLVALAGANRSEKETKNIPIFEKEGIKFAFLSYALASDKQVPNKFGLNIFEPNRVAGDIKAAKTEADMIIVSMSWGDELSSDINQQQADVSQFLADNGADIVLGHGQHVQGPVKKLKGKSGNQTVVWYGLGNFLHSKLEPETLFNGLAIIDIDTDKKQVSSLSFLPTYMHYEWTAGEKASGNILARKNLGIYTFDKASSLIPKSQNQTTTQDQTRRLSDILNKFTEVKIINPSQY